MKIWLPIVLPLLAAMASSVLGKRPNLREAFSLITGVLTFVSVWGWVGMYQRGEELSLTLFEILPGIDLSFELEPLGILFALIASGLWILTTLYAAGYMRAHHESHQSRFFACFALAIFAALGAAAAGNLLTLFLFYEILTLSTYPLVTHHGTEAAQRGGRMYLGILLTTSILLFLGGMIGVAFHAGTLDFSLGGILPEGLSPSTTLGLSLLLVFGAGKAALMPFHRWLPAAMVAPTPVSALLHAVAVVKCGVFTVLKVVLYVIGPAQLVNSGASDYLAMAAGFTIVAASVVALMQDNLKKRLAYSTISQLSYIVLGAVLATSSGILGGGLHIVTHAFGKITLFFCAGAIYITAHKTEISDMRGWGRAMPFTFAAFLIASLSIIGLPPFGGAWSKWFLGLGALEADRWPYVAILMISSLLNVAYLLPVAARGFWSRSTSKIPTGIHEAPAACLIPIGLTSVGCLALFFFSEGIVEWLQPLVAGLER